METHKFKLLSGVECEVQGITGEHQEIFTSQKNIKDGTFLDKFLHAVVVRLGSKQGNEITRQDITNLLSGDRRVIMLELRNFENDFDTNFEFTYKFNYQGKTLEHPIQVDLGQVTRKAYHTTEGKPFECVEYSQVNALKTQSVTLPKCGKEVFFTLLDGNQELEMNQYNAQNVSVLTDLQIRKPFYKSEDKAISFDLKQARAKDLNVLREAIKRCEGDVDTTVQFENPYDGTPIRFDVMHVTDFLFPALT